MAKREKFESQVIITKRSYDAITIQGRKSIIPKGQCCTLFEENGVKKIKSNDGRVAIW